MDPREYQWFPMALLPRWWERALSSSPSPHPPTSSESTPPLTWRRGHYLLSRFEVNAVIVHLDGHFFFGGFDGKGGGLGVLHRALLNHSA